MDSAILASKTKDELSEIAKGLGIKGVAKLKKSELLEKITGQDKKEEPVVETVVAEKVEEKPAVRSTLSSAAIVPNFEAAISNVMVDATYSPTTVGQDEIKPKSNKKRNNQDNRSNKNEEISEENLSQVEGLLEIREDGYGFLRTSGYLPSKSDAYVSAGLIRRFGLRKGDFIVGSARNNNSNEKYPAMVKIDKVSGLDPEQAKNRPKFSSLTPLFPDSNLKLEIDDYPNEITGRMIDLISPIGKGQRGLIVSPPKAGKTTIMKNLVFAIERNNPEVKLFVLLVDERPEEVTDMQRHILRGEVIASTFDRPAEEHTRVAELTLNRAKRLVEQGEDVVIILDGITRLARAYNLALPASGRILSGGVDTVALFPPKKFFGAARNVEEGGSLTIIATALVDTGSKMDEVIFEEFKGTGNMELKLDRASAERRLYPAVDVSQSGTRHEELLFDRNELNAAWKLRRVLNALESDGKHGAGLEVLIEKLKSTKTNREFLAEIAKNPSV